MASKHDWDYWRHKFVGGDDSVTLKSLSEIQGAPAYISLRKRSSAESWDEQRKRFRNSRDTQAIQQVAANEQVAARVEQLIDFAEMSARHMKAFRLAGSKAIAKLASVDPQTLTVREALDLMKWAVDGERLTEGLATQRQEIDLSTMTDAELEKLANGGA